MCAVSSFVLKKKTIQIQINYDFTFIYSPHFFRFQTEMLPMHVNPFEHSAKLNVLFPGTQYRICVIGLGNRLSSAMTMYYVSNMVADNDLINQFSDKLVSSSMDDPFFGGGFDGDDSGNILHINENKTEAIYWEFRY